MSFVYYLEEAGFMSKVKSAGKNIIKGILGKLFPKEVELLTKHPSAALNQMVKVDWKEVKGILNNMLKSKDVVKVTEGSELLVEKIDWQKVGEFLNKYKGPILLALIAIIFFAFTGSAEAGQHAQNIANMPIDQIAKIGVEQGHQYAMQSTDLMSQIAQTAHHLVANVQQVASSTGMELNGQHVGLVLNVPEGEQVKYVHNLVDYFKGTGLPNDQAISMAKEFFIQHIPVDQASDVVKKIKDMDDIGKQAGATGDSIQQLVQNAGSQMFDKLIAK